MIGARTAVISRFFAPLSDNVFLPVEREVWGEGEESTDDAALGDVVDLEVGLETVAAFGLVDHDVSGIKSRQFDQITSQFMSFNELFEMLKVLSSKPAKRTFLVNPLRE